MTALVDENVWLQYTIAIIDIVGIYYKLNVEIVEM